MNGKWAIITGASSGQQGVDALKAFVEAGGTLICLDQSGGLAIGMFNLPLR